MKKDEDISTDVEWFDVVEGELWQVVIDVPFILDVQAVAGLTAADAVSTCVILVDTEESEVHQTTEKDKRERRRYKWWKKRRKSETTVE